MQESARRRILESLPDDAVVLDIGAWAKPFPRADWVLDLEAYETRGQWGHDGDPADERFSADTWVQRDICDREPWPFDDDQFDFVICSHTLEDVRDPIWVCSEIVRIGKAGYIEVPSRLEEQTIGVQGDWVGWGHHHWLVDIDQERSEIRFMFKPHILGRRDVTVAFPGWVSGVLKEEERVSSLFWQGSFSFEETLIFDPGDHLRYLREPLVAHPEYARPNREQG